MSDTKQLGQVYPVGWTESSDPVDRQALIASKKAFVVSEFSKILKDRPLPYNEVCIKVATSSGLTGYEVEDLLREWDYGHDPKKFEDAACAAYDMASAQAAMIPDPKLRMDPVEAAVMVTGLKREVVEGIIRELRPDGAEPMESGGVLGVKP